MADKMGGKIALVTGGGSGIGKATSIAFAGEGAKVVVADINAGGGEETVRFIEDAGGDAVFVRADVSKAAEVEAMVNQAVATYGRLDYAYNNAGVLQSPGISIHEAPEETWNNTIATNLTGVWLCMKYEVPQMIKQGGGAIVNTSSVWGLVGAAGFSAYVASKHGVAGLTKTAALEYAESNIRVNCVNPGSTDTQMVQDAIGALSGGDPEAMADMIAQLHPIGRMGRPEEIAQAVVWLCSDAASFVTGHALSVDGGWTAQ